MFFNIKVFKSCALVYLKCFFGKKVWCNSRKGFKQFLKCCDRLQLQTMNLFDSGSVCLLDIIAAACKVFRITAKVGLTGKVTLDIRRS